MIKAWKRGKIDLLRYYPAKENKDQDLNSSWDLWDADGHWKKGLYQVYASLKLIQHL